MWIPILLISSLPGAVWAERDVRGVVGRAITIDCHYAAEYRSHTKYWCRGWSRRCTVLVETNGLHGRSGRVSITDNPPRGIFTVTVEDLHSEDAGWYSCGISSYFWDGLINVQLQVSDEPVSAPVLRYLSPANASRLGGSVTVSCESVRGSLPIHYTWCEKNEYGWSTILSGNQLDLSCELLGEPVSAPVLRFLSPANLSCLGGSLTVSCESMRGSLPISYSWYGKTTSVNSKISDNNALDLHCQSFKHQHHQYYCTASNQRGSKSSEMVTVSISSSGVPCSFLVKIIGTVTSHGEWGAGCSFSCL